ncbi:MAG: glutathione S-transferase N-terminal domain-containing protein [bacterium]
MTTHILYGTENSYYTGKARSYLRRKNIPFEERLATRKFYKEICLPVLGYAMIPLLCLPDGRYIQDTSLIIDHFELENKSLTPQGIRQRFASQLLEVFGDEWLLLPAMHYRWTYDSQETMLEFGKVLLPQADQVTQNDVGREAAITFQGFLPLLGIHDHNHQAIENSFLELIQELDLHFQHHDYLLGNRPSIGDFGLIGPLYAHLFRDATSGKIIRKNALNLCHFIERMMAPAGRPIGNYLDNDEIPETLLPILRRMMHEQMPCLKEMIDALSLWKDHNPDINIPRIIGSHDFTLQGRSATRAIPAYNAFLYQRPRHIYDQATQHEKASLNSLLEQIDGQLFIDTPIKTPVKIDNYRLSWA